MNLKKEFEKFIELRHLIECNPIDKKLLKKKLSENYFQKRLKTLSDVRSHMNHEEESNFFGRSTMKFFGTCEIKFSKKELTVITRNLGSGKERIVNYALVWNDRENCISLKCL